VLANIDVTLQPIEFSHDANTHPGCIRREQIIIQPLGGWVGTNCEVVEIGSGFGFGQASRPMFVRRVRPSDFTNPSTRHVAPLYDKDRTWVALYGYDQDGQEVVAAPDAS
jgi:hypothetical protein